MEMGKITSKGQTTVPKAIRELLGLKPGDHVRYVIRGDEVVLVPATRRIADLKGMLPKPKKPVTIEEMNEAIGQGRGR